LLFPPELVAWPKAAAQYRAATQLDPSQPEPYKALGDLFLIQPRRLFDQALEAYAKAIDLRPFYADAHVGLGDARAAKGDTDGAIKAYQQALVYNAVALGSAMVTENVFEAPEIVTVRWAIPSSVAIGMCSPE